MVCQKYIFKIHTSRLRKERWKLTLPIDEARRNDEVISLADSQVLRWIDELNGITDADAMAREIKTQIRQLRKEKNSPQNKRTIRKLYRQLDDIQFKPDYMCLIIDREKDYHRACRGFSINGVKYKRLLGTNGGIKNSTIVFVSDRLADELKRRIDNGRDLTKELVTAKLEAYRALACSASVPVSTPNGILIVNDAETEFLSDILYLTDEGEGEPVMELRRGEKITMDASDGFGLMLPSLAERWSEELGLDYTVSGVNTRFSFEKGMMFTFDFLGFADKVAGSYIVRDAWGNDVDIRSVEAVFTTSMVKLWDSYKSCDDYVSTSLSNGYTFCVTKTTPKTLESERALNYQFIQSYALSDEDIDELIRPTMEEFRDVLRGDWRKTVLFLKGSGLNESNVERLPDDFIKAIMIDRRVLDDPFVQNSVYQLIRNRINQAKVGVLNVHGNYSIISGDPYLLCQSLFGLEKTGLLKAGEIYNEYWANAGADRLACFRAPMTCHNNIRLVHVADSDDTRHWYRYMNTVTILNGWDTITAALNGADMDGDIVMLTDNKILVNRIQEMPTLMCAQRKAKKCVPSEGDFIRANIESFGNDIGQTTNWITSMFEVQSHYEKGSKEYEALAYRIRCGQLYQQNAIDRAKGIVCKPMPRSWHDRFSASGELYRKIVADRKPYFMRYIYPSLMNQYNKYIKNTERNSMREFGVGVQEMIGMSSDNLSDRQNEFIRFYKSRMPVGMGDCVMNKICRRFEREFDGYVGKQNSHGHFDYRFMKSRAEYTPRQYQAVKRLYEEYNKRVIGYAAYTSYERIDEADSSAALAAMNEEFRRDCDIACPNAAALCNIVLDMCYTKSSTKRFAWNMCGSEIIENLLDKNGYEISYPSIDRYGDITYCGERFSIGTKRVGVTYDDRFE